MALRFGRPFAVVPCCVFPDAFAPRTLADGVTNVRSYEDFCTYLTEKAPPGEIRSARDRLRNMRDHSPGG